MMTERVQRLKKSLLSVRPNITPERLLLATEAYKKYAGESIPIFKARVLEYVLDNLSITIFPDEMIVGAPTYRLRGANLFPEFTSTEWLLKEIPEFPTRPMDQIDVTEEDKKVIMECLTSFWEGRAIEDLLERELPADVKELFDTAVIDLGLTNTTSGETVPDYETMLKRGIKAYVDDCKEKIRKEPTGTPEAHAKIDFWRSCIIVCEAVIRFANRYADEAERQAEAETNLKRRTELLIVASNCRNVPENPPKGFYEALQFVWFVPQYYVENSHEGIIPKDLYMQVQEEMVRRANLKAGKKKRVYSSKYALSSLVFCSKCGDIYRRIAWNNRSKHSIVWRCCNRVEHGPAACDAETIPEEDLQMITVKAFNQLYGNKENMLEILSQNIHQVIDTSGESLDAIESRLEDLQQQLLKKANSKQSYDKLANEIFELREKKQNVMAESAEKNGYKKRISELEEFLHGFELEITEYDEQLVRSYIQKITVYDDRFNVEFKAGFDLNIAK